MRAALSMGAWDVIISDYRLPQFSGLDALKLVIETGVDTPFIIISGVIGEDTAVEAMKLGARDYLMKDRLSRLAPAVQREIREARLRRDQALLLVENASYESELEELKSIASEDALTGLANRRELERQIALRIDAGNAFCVVNLDLNGFKELNDTYGHLAGDDLLKQFADELRGAFRSKDVVGRLGGDEFVVLVDHDLPVASTRLERIRKRITGKYQIKGQKDGSQVHLTFAGAAAEWQPGESARDLLGRADAAMYADKREAAVR
jgi:diguanylate cyclase (GGDEF)-like protein